MDANKRKSAVKSKSIPIKKHIIRYGFIFGVASVIFSLASYLTDNYVEPGLFHLIILLLITMTSITAGLLMFKKSNNGYINLSEALKIAIGISLLGGLMAILWKVLLINIIDPEIITQIEDKQIKRVVKNSIDLSHESINRSIAATKKYTSPMRMIVRALVEDLGNGIIFGLICGLILQKKRDPFK
ncbi:DUF4199 domain-containing protein [Aquimarina sp. M1]